MYCVSCASSNQEEFTAEIDVHFRGPKNLDKPTVLVFPKIFVCLDCGFSRFSVPTAELALLAGDTMTREAPSRPKSVSDLALCG